MMHRPIKAAATFSLGCRFSSRCRQRAVATPIWLLSLFSFFLLAPAFGATRSIVVPHVAGVYGWATTLTAFNPSTGVQSFTYTPVSDSGAAGAPVTHSVPGLGSIRLATPEDLSDQGSGRIETSASLIFTLRYRYGDSLSVCDFILSETRSTGWLLPNPQVDWFSWVGVAFVNPNASAATVTVRAFRNGALSATQPVTVPAQAKTASLSTSLLTLGPGDFDWIHLESDLPISAPLVIAGSEDQDRHLFTAGTPVALDSSVQGLSASFGFSPEGPVTGNPVTFTDASTGNPTSWSWDFGDGGTSTERNPSHTYSQAGIFAITLTVGKGVETSSTRHCLSTGTHTGRPPFTMASAIGDGGQTMTLAFDGFGMITGNLAAQSFFPPGKVADYWGFQYFRDNDPDDMGHNTSFLSRIADNVIYILNDTQLAALKTLAHNQVGQINLYAYERYPLMQAFRRQLEGTLPAGSAGLNEAAVVAASRELYQLDGQISFDRAVLYADIYRSLTTSQTSYLDAMKGVGWNSWPQVPGDQVRARLQGLPQDEMVAVMTYASDMFTWYAGAVDADVYFCPERHGTYFGSFYLKDAPAIGHEGYSIDEQLTASAGQVFLQELARTNLDPLVSNLTNLQRDNLYASPTANIVKSRTEISSLLRSVIGPEAPSESERAALLAQVLEKSGIYGELDGENVWRYAMAFAEVEQALTDDQRLNLEALRHAILSGAYNDGTPFDFTVCTTYYLYSATIPDLSVLDPYIGDTDYLFFEP